MRENDARYMYVHFIMEDIVLINKIPVVLCTAVFYIGSKTRPATHTTRKPSLFKRLSTINSDVIVKVYSVYLKHACILISYLHYLEPS